MSGPVHHTISRVAPRSVSYRRLRVMSAKHLALVLHSCVTLGQAPSGRWLAAYEVVTAARMNDQTADGLSLLSYTYGMLERTPSKAWLGALYGAAARVSFDDFDAMQLERLIWGIAKLEQPPDAISPGWFESFLARCAVQMHEMSYCNLANVLFALAMLGVKPKDDWLVAAAERAGSILEDFGYTTAAKALWALPRLLPPHDDDDGAAVSDTEVRQAIAGVERLLEARVRRMMRMQRSG